jgi:pilus assembly protein CpaF
MRDSKPSSIDSDQSTSPPSTSETKERGGLGFRDYQELKNGIHRYLLNKVDLEKVAAVPDDRTRSQVLAVIQNLVSYLKIPFSDSEKERLSREILDEVFGLGPLEPLLEDPSISDILVNGAKEVYVERAGVLEETKIMFKDDAHLMRIIDKIVSAIGRRVDQSSPMVDAAWINHRPWWTLDSPTALVSM